MIDTKDVVEALAPHRGDAVVIHTMMAIRYWNQVSRRPDLDIPISNGMSKAVSLGLGIALAQPQRKVIVLDGDGSLLMNLGALVTVAHMAPRNLYHPIERAGGAPHFREVQVYAGLNDLRAHKTHRLPRPQAPTHLSQHFPTVSTAQKGGQMKNVGIIPQSIKKIESVLARVKHYKDL